MKKNQKTGRTEANESKNNVTDPTVLGNNGQATGKGEIHGRDPFRAGGTADQAAEQVWVEYCAREGAG